jgi:hypothetical protein
MRFQVNKEFISKTTLTIKSPPALSLPKKGILPPFGKGRAGEIIK